MAASAQQITGIIVSDSGPMMVNGESAVHKLMKWIEGFPIVILVAHSGRRYHFPVLNFNPPGCHFKVFGICKRLY